MKIKHQAEKKLNQNTRWHALKLIHQISDEQAYSNVVLNQFLSNCQFDQRDQDLITQLVYGTIQHQLTLDFYLLPFIQHKRLESWVRALLRMSAYQLIYLDRLPNHAVLNEAVKIAKLNGHQSVANLVNAVLRQLLRQPLNEPGQLTDLTERYAIQYSMPKWLVTYFDEYLTESQLEALLASFNQKPQLSLRVNGKPATRDQLHQDLELAGYTVSDSQLSPYGIRVQKGNPTRSELFQKGDFTVQDESSMLVAPLGRLENATQVLDACSAPGGKATHILHLMKQGAFTGLDISANKLEKVSQHIERLKLNQKPNLSIDLIVQDALAHQLDKKEVYDQIYLDAPCSGLGLMRRKPEIRYQKTRDQIFDLANIQAKLLDHMAQLLRVGGTMIYSTCTLAYEENEIQIAQFLERHPNFRVDKIDCTEVGREDIITAEGYLRIWPHQYHTDGFFIARLNKVM